MTNVVGDIWYRYEDVSYASALDSDGDPYGKSTLTINLHIYEVVRVTPKGVQLVEVFGTFRASDTRLVLNNAHKKFACPSAKLARESFIARKKRQRGIYKARMERANEALSLIRSEYHSMKG